jgi:ribosomal protein L40E/PKD repeat protein
MRNIQSNERRIWWVLLLVLLLYMSTLSVPCLAAPAPVVTGAIIKDITAYQFCGNSGYFDVTVASTKTSLAFGETATITVTVRNATTHAVAGNELVQLSGYGSNLMSASSGQTDSSGKFTSTFTAKSPEAYTLSAKVVRSGDSCPWGTGTKSITVTNKDPVAKIIASPASGAAPLSVTFNGATSTDPEGGTLTYKWSFGDGTADGSGVQMVHKYQNQGNFTAILTVTDPLGETHFVQQVITVSPGATTTVTTAPVTTTITNVTTTEAGVIPTGAPGEVTARIVGGTGTVEPGQTLNVEVLVTGPGNTPVSGASVTLATSGGQVSPQSGTTDASGRFVTSFSSASVGNYTLNATVLSGGATVAVSPAVVTVRQSAMGLPLIPLIIGIIIAAIVIGILLFLLTRSKLSIEIKEKSIAADGKSTTNVKVQFTNGLGSLQKQKNDQEVQMSATAGTIQNIRVPEGKAYGETSLTSSLQCGTVTVSASSGGKTATANLQFACTDATLELAAIPPEIPADGKSTSTIIIRTRNREGQSVSYLNERTVELSTTLGSVTSPVKIAAGALEGTAMITSGQISGIASVNAVADKQARGTGSVKLGELAKRYCMHCGSPMTMEAQNCPKCGKTPPSGVDTKVCPACGAVLPTTSVYCDRCGSKQG